LTEVRLWYEENEFERLVLREYQAKTHQIEESVSQLQIRRRNHERMTVDVDRMMVQLTKRIQGLISDVRFASSSELSRARSELNKVVAIRDELADETALSVCFALKSLRIPSPAISHPCSTDLTALRNGHAKMLILFRLVA
jgi:hypothetical protein